jgi:hypothetical protein
LAPDPPSCLAPNWFHLAAGWEWSRQVGPPVGFEFQSPPLVGSRQNCRTRRISTVYESPHSGRRAKLASRIAAGEAIPETGAKDALHKHIALKNRSNVDNRLR